MLTRALRAATIVFWIVAYGFAVFFVAGVGVFAWMRGEHPIAVALCTIAGLTLLAFVVYAVRIRLRFAEDWQGLSPRGVGVRVFLVLFNGPGSAKPNGG